MKKSSVGFAVCALLLAGCQTFREGGPHPIGGFDPLSRRPDPFFPKVFISSGGNIVVDQEPIRIPKGEGARVTITWALAADSSGIASRYMFDGEGIEIGDDKKKDKRFPCKPLDGPRKLVVCSFERADVKPGTVVKYTVRVRSEKGSALLDPTIMLE